MRAISAQLWYVALSQHRDQRSRAVRTPLLLILLSVSSFNTGAIAGSELRDAGGELTVKMTGVALVKFGLSTSTTKDGEHEVA